MLVYKITNQINQKIYIGQTSKTIEERFQRHIYDTINNRIDTHLARAIRKYGPNNFTVIEIDRAETQEELNQKEVYWIHFYNSIEMGYNETDSCLKSGGNTYKYKTSNELKEIKQKISSSKKAGKNPQATAVKCRNINTDEEYYFDSISEMQAFFNETNHNFITRRCLGQTKCLYRKQWQIAYANENYPEYSVNKNNARARKIQVTNLLDNTIYKFNSYAEAERYFQLSEKTFSGKAYKHKEEPYFIIKNQYKIEILN